MITKFPLYRICASSGQAYLIMYYLGIGEYQFVYTDGQKSSNFPYDDDKKFYSLKDAIAFLMKIEPNAKYVDNRSDAPLFRGRSRWEINLQSRFKDDVAGLNYIFVT